MVLEAHRFIPATPYPPRRLGSSPVRKPHAHGGCLHEVAEVFSAVLGSICDTTLYMYLCFRAAYRIS